MVDHIVTEHDNDEASDKGDGQWHSASIDFVVLSQPGRNMCTPGHQCLQLHRCHL